MSLSYLWNAFCLWLRNKKPHGLWLPAPHWGLGGEGGTPPSKVDTPWASSIIGLLLASSICADNPSKSSFGWCVYRVRLCYPVGKGTEVIGPECYKLVWLIYEAAYRVFRTEQLQSTFTLVGSFHPNDSLSLLRYFIFTFLLLCRRRPLLELHIELNSSVYDWNSRVSAKEKYYVWLQHTLRKKLILSCTWKAKGPF